MTNADKLVVQSLANSATDYFYKYRNCCEAIEKVLIEHSNEDIEEVLYQISDGIVVCVNRNEQVSDNIPIEDYLQEIEQ